MARITGAETHPKARQLPFFGLKTQDYFSQGHWTREASQAQHFTDSGKAIDACLRYRRTDVGK